MKLPRELSGKEPVKHHCKFWEYLMARQVGSHRILQNQQPPPGRIQVVSNDFSSTQIAQST
jgi:hypothetical protein